MLKAKELKDQSVPELESQVKDLYKNLFELNGKRRGLKDHKVAGEYRNARKDLARVLTVLTEKKQEG